MALGEPSGGLRSVIHRRRLRMNRDVIFSRAPASRPTWPKRRRSSASRSGPLTTAHKRRLQRAASRGVARYDLFRRHILFTFQAVLAASAAMSGRLHQSVEPRAGSHGRSADPNQLVTMDAESAIRACGSETIVIPTAWSAAGTANSRSFAMTGPCGRTRSPRSPSA
jgi:hypothetical protein